MASQSRHLIVIRLRSFCRKTFGRAIDDCLQLGHLNRLPYGLAREDNLMWPLLFNDHSDMHSAQNNAVQKAQETHSGIIPMQTEQ